jgi:hypothetical protein
MALKWHPDRNMNNKEEAEKRLVSCLLYISSLTELDVKNFIFLLVRILCSACVWKGIGLDSYLQRTRTSD